MEKMRVLVADDHAVVRSGLRMLIDAQPDMTVVGEAGDGWEALRQLEALRPDLLLLDLAMPGLGGLAIIHQAKQESPATRILVLTMHEEHAYLRQALKAGASGYLVKSALDTELLTAIRAIRRGEVYVHSSLTAALVDMAFEERADAGAEDSAPVSKLSKRELEVFRFLALGYTNQQIAEEVLLSVKTVETYRARLMEKLQVSTRAELVRLALQHGLVQRGE